MTNTLQLTPTPLMHYEFVIGHDDFAVLVNGDCAPVEFDGYSVDSNWCLVLHQKGCEVLTEPVPPEVRPLVESVENIVFGRMANGAFVDAKDLPRIWPRFNN